MHERRSYSRLHWRTQSRTEVAVQLETRAWNASTRLIALGSFETVYFSFFIHDGVAALMHVKVSRKEGLMGSNSQRRRKQ